MAVAELLEAANTGATADTAGESGEAEANAEAAAAAPPPPSPPPASPQLQSPTRMDKGVAQGIKREKGPKSRLRSKSTKAHKTALRAQRM